jgi:ferredoxin
MSDQPHVNKVWIETGCIVCDACESACPEVFSVTEETCTIRPEAEHPEYLVKLTVAIQDAAEECPVGVIQYETVGADRSSPQSAA